MRAGDRFDTPDRSFPVPYGGAGRPCQAVSEGEFFAQLQAFVRACNNKSILIIAPHGVAEQSMEPESRAVDKGFLLDVTLSDPLQGLPPPMNPMVAIATWTTCGPGRGRGELEQWELLFGGGRWRFFPLALPLTLPLARLVWKMQAAASQPASHTVRSTAAKQQPNSGDPRPVAFLRFLPNPLSCGWLGCRH